MVLVLKSEIPKSVQDDFIKTGLFHVLVISGQNISLLLLFLFTILNWIASKSEYFLLHFPLQRIIILISLWIIVSFCFFSGGDIPIFRATLMALSSLVSLWTSRAHLAFWALGLALALILNFIPSSLFDPSFQLSFMAVFGINLLPILLGGEWKNIQRRPFYLILLTTLAATILTTPLIIYHFHRCSLIGVLSNVIAAPILSFFLLPLSFIITFFYFIFEPLSTFLIMVTLPFYKLFVDMVHLLSQIPGASITIHLPSELQLIFIYCVLFVVFYFISKRQWKNVTSGILVGCILLLGYSFLTQWIRVSDSRLRVSFLSVGQGDSTLLELPHGKTMLIDGGGLFGFDVGERLVAPYLWRKGIRKIDVVILSHSDYDHIQGFHFILEHFRVGEIWLSQFQGRIFYYKLIELAERKKIPCKLFLSTTLPHEMNGVQFYFLSPSNVFGKYSDNDLSLVVTCRFKKFSLLFPGDIEKEVEEKLIYQTPCHLLRSTILKVPHHGSKTSSSIDFLRTVSPQLAVMSVGRDNRYRLPSPEILDRYEKLGIHTWRTDLHGSLRVISDGEIISYGKE